MHTYERGEEDGVQRREERRMEEGREKEKKKRKEKKQISSRANYDYQEESKPILLTFFITKDMLQERKKKANYFIQSNEFGT